jgi:hypothetical protein
MNFLKRLIYKAVAQDSRNFSDLGNKLGWDWLEQEGKTNTENPSRALRKAAISAATWYAGGLLGAGAGAGGSAASSGATSAAETAAEQAAWSAAPYAYQAASPAAEMTAQQLAQQAALEASKQGTAGVLQNYPSAALDSMGNAATHAGPGGGGAMELLDYGSTGANGMMNGSPPVTDYSLIHTSPWNAIKNANSFGEGASNLGAWAKNGLLDSSNGITPKQAMMGQQAMGLLSPQQSAPPPAPPPPMRQPQQPIQQEPSTYEIQAMLANKQSLSEEQKSKLRSMGYSV